MRRIESMKYLPTLYLYVLGRFAVLAQMQTPTLPIPRPPQGSATNGTCRQFQTIVDCSSGNWITIPTPQAGQTPSTLLLNNNIISSLPSNAFQPWAINLTSLDLSYNHITSIGTDAFVVLTKLANLDLSHNRISTFPASLLLFPQALRGLSLRYNLIKELRFNVSSWHKTMETLLLDNNKIAVASGLPVAFPALLTLTLRSNLLSSWQMNDMPNTLLHLDLRENSYYTISNFGQPSKLQSLRIGNSVYSASDTDLTNLRQLTSLEVTKATAFNSFPVGFFSSTTQLTSVYFTNSDSLKQASFPSNATTIYLENLAVEAIQGGWPATLQHVTIINCSMLKLYVGQFSGLNLLQTVYLKNLILPDVNSVSNGLASATALQEFTLDNVGLTEFNAKLHLGGGGSVRILNLNGNRMSSITASQFQFMSSLENITVSNNNLTTFSLSVFRLNSKLNYVDASNNNIVTVYASAADLFPTRPTTINLSGNRIQQIDPVFLERLTALRNIDLSMNNITNFASFQNATSPDLTVVASGNPWSCDVADVAAYKQLPSNVTFACDIASGIMIRPCILCQSPSSAKGKYLDEVIRAGPPTTTSTLPHVTPTLTGIIGGGASACVCLLVLLVCCLVVRRRRKRSVELQTSIVAEVTSMPKTANQVYENNVTDDEQYDLEPYMEIKAAQKKNTVTNEISSSHRSFPATNEVLQVQPAATAENSRSVYEEGYILVPEGQALPGHENRELPRVPGQQRSAYEQGYANYPTGQATLSTTTEQTKPVVYQNIVKGGLADAVAHLYGNTENSENDNRIYNDTEAPYLIPLPDKKSSKGKSKRHNSF